MKIAKYLAMVPVGVIAASAIATGPCAADMVPCEGPETLNGYGCGTGCFPFSSGCCEYTEYRVNCDSGPDQFYRLRTCKEVQNCKWIVLYRHYECTHL